MGRERDKLREKPAPEWNRNSRISMRQDFPLEIEQRRRKLFPILQAAKNNLMYKKNSYLTKDKLFVNGRSYTVDTLHQLPSDLLPCNIAMRHGENAVLFWGRDAPFSNFYACDFIIDGTRYKSMEEYLCVRKAEISGHEDAAENIKSETDPGKQKQMARNLKPFDEKAWQSCVRDIAMKGLEAKFDQNPHVKNLLIQTRGKVIGEMSFRDHIWGTGVGLYHKDAFDHHKWPGQNCLGKWLMELRDSVY